MIPPSSWGPFEVEFTQLQKAQIRQLGIRAHAAGFGPQFVDDFRTILEKLQNAPREWGDPLFPLRGLALAVHRGIHARISVTYGIHHRLPIVFVREFKPILGHPLASE